MSVIIKNREMPEGCVECWNRFSCKHFEISFIRLNTRHPDCPLIEVPAPHGRLIDADALIARMESDAEQMEEPIAQMFTYAAINDVKHSETVIEAEETK